MLTRFDPQLFLVAQSTPDHFGLKGTDAVQLPGGVEKLSAGVAVHLGDISGEPERDSLGLLCVTCSGVRADQAGAVPGPVSAIGLGSASRPAVSRSAAAP